MDRQTKGLTEDRQIDRRTHKQTVDSTVFPSEYHFNFIQTETPSPAYFTHFSKTIIPGIFILAQSKACEY